MTEWEIICDDVIRWAAEYDGSKFHALLADPSYALSKKKKIDPNASIEAEIETVADLIAAYHSVQQWGDTGFMDKAWDTDIAFDPRTWAALAEHLHPGGFIIAFASSRGWHRLTCAMEDAGLIIQPSIFGWLNAQAFPKATRIDTAIDKAAGKLEERKVVGYRPAFPDGTRNANRRPDNFSGLYGDGLPDRGGTVPIEQPATDLARAWQGHRYGGQILKDALNPIVVAYKDLTCEPICDIIVETTFLMEVLLCIHSPVQDAESPTSQIHQHLRAVVEDFVRGNADVWVSLKNVSIAGKPSESSQATMTLHDFVVGPVLIRDVINQLGVQVGSSAKDTLISDIMGSTLRSIGLSWNNILADLSNHGSMFITSTKINLITDLRILRSYLSETISALTIPVEQSGLQSLVLTVENLLRSLVVKLPLLSDTIATGNAIGQLVEMENDREASQRVGAKNEIRPIIVAQKPWEGKRLDCIVETGAGALNIEAARMGTNETLTRDCLGLASADHEGWKRPWHGDAEKKQWGSTGGRWPSNFCLIHSEGCERVGVKRVKGSRIEKPCPEPEIRGYKWGTMQQNRPARGIGDPDGMEAVDEWRCVPECPARRLGEQSGVSKSPVHRKGYERTSPHSMFGDQRRGSDGDYADKGTCARFFYQADWSHEVAERIANADPVRYCPKAARKERDAGLENMPLQKGHSAYGDFEGTPEHATNKDGKLRNNHPCIKPINLCKWLATLLLPPKEYAPRRILIPFCGTMSEGIGALLAGFEEIVGVDFQQDYCDIAEARMTFWQQQKRLETAQMEMDLTNG